MAVQESRPNIVVDENFIMLEKRLRRRYAQRASAYSNAETIEQEKNGARAFAIAPEAYGDSKFIGGISSFENGKSESGKFMTTDDYVAYFGKCHDTFGAMNFETVAPATKKADDEPRVLVNCKKIEQIKKLGKAENVRAKKSDGNVSTNTVNVPNRAVKVKQDADMSGVKLDNGKIESFWLKMSKAKGRALASVAAFAICCTVAVGGVFALNSSDDGTVAMDMMRKSEACEQPEDDAHTNLLSTLE